ncbi:pentapeptide repeat-containing protein [Streptomyces sp. NPDC048248]|uniref:pentapeptide repeat-containing protein n=1 Tax=Streptomyces sp. NPDC048248 TaxID=3365523 RepID=UPI00371453EE
MSIPLVNSCRATERSLGQQGATSHPRPRPLLRHQPRPRCGHIGRPDLSCHGAAHFEEAAFSGDAAFDGVRFGGSAWFTRADIEGNAEFNGVEFSGEARFEGAHVGGGASFERATFDAGAWFLRTDIAATAVFGGAKFNGEASFIGARLGMATMPHLILRVAASRSGARLGAPRGGWRAWPCLRPSVRWSCFSSRSERAGWWSSGPVSSAW